MAQKPPKHGKEFGSRKPSLPNVVRPPGPPVKRSGNVALLLMGTLAVGTTAYTLMPSNKCDPNVAQPSLLQHNAECPPRSSSSSSSGGGSGGSSSSSRYYSGSSSSGSSSSGGYDSGSHSTSRGGFGSFGHAVGFSGG
jgi:hypothetical protein